MKFLQKPKEHQDEVAQNDKTHEPSMKDRKRRAENEEISAYFETTKDKPKRPVTAPNRHEGRLDGKKAPQREAQQNQNIDQESSPRLPPESQPQVPFLGFGSRCIVHDSSRARRTTSLLSWSESVPRQASAHLKTTNSGNDHMPPAEIAHPQAYEQPVGQKSTERRHEEGSRDVYGKHGSWLPSRRERQLAVVEVYQPTETAQATRMRRPTSYTSLSLPRLPGSENNQARVSNGEAGSGTDLSNRSYRTSDILRVRARMQALADQPNTGSVDTNNVIQSKEIITIPSLSSTSKLLVTAQNALLAARSQTRRHTLHNMYRGTVEPGSRSQSLRNRSNLGSRKISADVVDQTIHTHIRSRPQHRSTEDNGSRSVSRNTSEPRIPPEPTSLMSSRPSTSHIWAQSIPRYAPADPDDNDEMLLDCDDPVFDERHLVLLQGNEANAYRGMAQDYDHTTEPRMVVYGDEDHRAVQEQFQWPRVSSTPAGVAYAPWCAREVDHGQFSTGDSTAEDVMRDFWRPNRLY